MATATSVSKRPTFDCRPSIPAHCGGIWSWSRKALTAETGCLARSSTNGSPLLFVKEAAVFFVWLLVHLPSSIALGKSRCNFWSGHRFVTTLAAERSAPISGAEQAFSPPAPRLLHKGPASSPGGGAISFQASGRLTERGRTAPFKSGSQPTIRHALRPGLALIAIDRFGPRTS
jgi:hypothetical protein